jgi:putative nucleotidyltransferase with HDIG domain
MEKQGRQKRRSIRFTSNIPPFPKTVQRVLNMLRDPRIQLTKVAEVVMLDQGFAGKVLKMANSAYFGLPRRVYNVTEALVLLGFANVRNVLISASVGHILCQSLEAYGLEAGSLWEHSVGVAYGTQILSRRVNVRLYSMAFSCGLLHDVGKVAINKALDEAERQRLRRQSQIDEKAEIDIAGITHGAVGAKICEEWNLPPEIIEAVRFHHNPDSSGGTLAGIVCASDLCTNLLLKGRAEITERDLQGGPQGIYMPGRACLEDLSRDLPLMIASSRQLVEGQSEVLTPQGAGDKK